MVTDFVRSVWVSLLERSIVNIGEQYRVQIKEEEKLSNILISFDFHFLVSFGSSCIRSFELQTDNTKAK